jgi:four helix bundle protein
MRPFARLAGRRKSCAILVTFFRQCALKGVDRHTRNRRLRASQSIPLNIAEGNGKGTDADRRRYFEIARDSALEFASIQDCLEACDVLSVAPHVQGKTMLTRIVSMLTKLGRRSHEVREVTVSYSGFDYDNDNEWTCPRY